MNNGVKRSGATGQERVYDFIVDFIMKNRYSPSVKEICAGVNMSSKASVYYHLVILKRMGKIDMKEKISRSISLVGYKLVKEGEFDMKASSRLDVNKSMAMDQQTLKQVKKELTTLADDFCLLHREDVQKIIETCKSYEEGRQKIMKVYTAVYMR